MRPEPVKPTVLVDRHTPPDVLTLRRMVIDRGHRWFDSLERPYNLNIVGIRVPDGRFDYFDDWLVTAWPKDTSGPGATAWNVHVAKITTLPGETYMVNRLLNPAGCAILCGGQYRGTYGIARHRGQYEALCQIGGPVPVYRDGNRDRVFDLKPSTIISGWFGINIHNSRDNRVTLRVGSHSAGCQVFADDRDFETFMRLCRLARAAWGNSFTYTLLDLRAEAGKPETRIATNV